MPLDVKVTAPFVPPVVDSLAVRVVVDSSYEMFMAEATHPHVAIAHTRRTPGHEMTTLAGEWGLSLHLQSAQAGASAQYLLDFGYTPEVLNRNVDILGIDAGRLDGLILSHGHRDHFGGLVGFVETHRPAMRDEVSLYAGAEDVFRQKWTGGMKSPVSWGALDRAALEARHVHTEFCGAPHALAGPFTSGYIERQSFERIIPSTLVAPEEHFTEAERAGRLVHDQHPDEHATCYVVKGRGLVVISSCGHAGLINTIRTAMAVANTDRLHAVLGGFHLGPAPADYIDHTLDELARLAPDVIIPMHCSGSNFIRAATARMPDRVVASNIGSRFTFGV